MKCLLLCSQNICLVVALCSCGFVFVYLILFVFVCFSFVTGPVFGPWDKIIISFFVKRIGDFLTTRWERPYSVVTGWVRLAFPLQFFRLHCCVCVAVKLNEGV